MIPHTLTNTIAAAASAVALSTAVAMSAAANGNAWLYANNTLTDGEWTLSTSGSADALVISFKSYTEGVGEGVLDLSKPVTNAAGASCAIATIGISAFACNSYLARVVMPDTLVSIRDQAFKECNGLAGDVTITNVQMIGSSVFTLCTSLESVHIDVPGALTIGNYLFKNDTNLTYAVLNVPQLKELSWAFSFDESKATYGKLTNVVVIAPQLETMSGTFNCCYYLTNLVLTAPNLKNLGSDTFQKCGRLAIDAAQLVPSGVTNIGNAVFYGCPLLTGVLDLPNVRNIDPSDAFRDCTGLTEIRLGSPDLGLVGRRAFQNTAKLQSITIGSTNKLFGVALDSGNDTYPGSAATLTNITFYGPAPAQTNIDFLLGKVTANNKTTSSGAHGCVLRVSKHQNGWSALATDFENLEATADKPAGCFGVYVTASGDRKAWLVQAASPYDGPGGFVIRICESDVAVPYLWITNNLAAADRASDVAISNALVTTGANGLNRWESYVLGLDPNDATSVVICDARQDAVATQLTFAARNVLPATNTNLLVNYVLNGSRDGRVWSDLVSSTTNSLPIGLPCPCVFFRVRTDIVLQ